MSFYTSMRDGVAAKLLAQYGMPATLSKTSGQTYDKAAGEMTGGATLTYPTSCVKQEYSAKALADDSLIQRGDAKLLMPGSVGAVPTIGDKVILGSETLAIVNVDTLAPGGIAVMYTIQARK